MDIESKAVIETIIEEIGDFSLECIPTLLPKLIAHVQQFKNFKGEQKKSLIIKMLNHIVDITDSPGDDAIWDPILKRLIPGFIDTLLKVENGKLKLKKKNRLLFCC